MNDTKKTVITLRKCTDIICDYCPYAYCHDDCVIEEILRFRSDILDDTFEID